MYVCVCVCVCVRVCVCVHTSAIKLEDPHIRRCPFEGYSAGSRQCPGTRMCVHAGWQQVRVGSERGVQARATDHITERLVSRLDVGEYCDVCRSWDTGWSINCPAVHRGRSKSHCTHSIYVSIPLCCSSQRNSGLADSKTHHRHNSISAQGDSTHNIESTIKYPIGTECQRATRH
jgi:hypothetical protein